MHIAVAPHGCIVRRSSLTQINAALTGLVRVLSVPVSMFKSSIFGHLFHSSSGLVIISRNMSFYVFRSAQNP